MAWEEGPGVVVLPDGARLRGRGLRGDAPAGPPPQLAVYLRGRRPPLTPWPAVWVRWPDFLLPRDRDAADDALALAHQRALAGERVEIACGGGRGRTGTAIACIAQLAGIPAKDSVAWVREHYHPKAVETPWQRRYAEEFTDRRAPS